MNELIGLAETGN